MLFFILSYIGGAMTILAPCILPVVPFIFARAGQPFVTTGLPLLGGMALTFAAVGTLAAVAGDWAVQTNEYGRIAAIIMLAALGLALVAPRWAERFSRPLVALGSRLSNAATSRTAASGNHGPAGSTSSRALSSFFLGIAVGFLWAPCAGPILGLILTGAALEGPSVQTSLLLLAYAAGAATSLSVVLLAGGRLAAALKRSLGLGEWVRKLAGFAVLAGVAAVALGLDTGLLAQFSSGGGAAALEKSIFERLAPKSPGPAPLAAAGLGALDPAYFVKVQARPKLATLPVEGMMPPLTGGVEWLNSPPLTPAELRGKVVLVDFWTFGCINCRNALPYVRGWHRKYKDQGLVVIGVHSPEFAFEKNIGNVKRALVDLDVPFPVVVDNKFAIWRAFSNQYWPAHYFVDASGRIRFHHFGEGEYEKSEQVIQQLLEEARSQSKPL